MKFSDFFVPKYLHSDPRVRMKFISSTNDVKLLQQIAEKDGDNDVVRAAQERLAEITVVHTS